MNKYTIGILIILFVLMTYFWNRSIRLNADRDRISHNFVEIQNKGNSDLVLTKSELKNAIKSKTELGIKIDSLLKVAKIKPRQAEEVVIASIQYRDSCQVQAIAEPIKPLPSGRFEIPVTFNSKCWGLHGKIETADSTSHFFITERSTSIEADLIDSNYRRWFLGKLRHKYTILTDCGEIKVAKVTIK